MPRSANLHHGRDHKISPGHGYNCRNTRAVSGKKKGHKKRSFLDSSVLTNTKSENFPSVVSSTRRNGSSDFY